MQSKEIKGQASIWIPRLDLYEPKDWDPSPSQRNLRKDLWNSEFS